jgi:hypothetical protein
VKICLKGLPDAPASARLSDNELKLNSIKIIREYFTDKKKAISLLYNIKSKNHVTTIKNQELPVIF